MAKHAEGKQIGLEIGQIFGRYLLGTDDLHYGYWTDDLDVHLLNFPQAQARHSELILQHIPAEVKSVLDVGGGAGNLARKLADRGLAVELVVPSAYLAERCREKLGEQVPVHECTLQELELARTFDLILFSESFQYIDVREAFDKSVRLVRPGGYLLICDCFRKGRNGTSKGGVPEAEFQAELPRQPLRVLVDLDMTAGIAPSFDVFRDMIDNLAVPIGDVLSGYSRRRFPRLSKLVTWRFRKKIEKVQRRYFSGQISAETFAREKSYRLMLFQRHPAG